MQMYGQIYQEDTGREFRPLHAVHAMPCVAEVISATIQRNCEEMHARRSEVLASVPLASEHLPRQHLRRRDSQQLSGRSAAQSPYVTRLVSGNRNASPAQIDAAILTAASEAAAAAGAAAAAAAAAAHKVASFTGNENGASRENDASTGNGAPRENGASSRNAASSGNGASNGSRASNGDRASSRNGSSNRNGSSREEENYKSRR